MASSALHGRSGGCLCGAVRYTVHGPLREILWEAPGRETVSMGAGTLDDPAGLRVAGHIWLEQGALWEAPGAGVPTYPRGYPGDAPTLAWGSAGTIPPASCSPS